ncbi:MAG: response regulator [Ruminiclostridium sp.]|nr:response regulator [Ruminiclostridium sp.]
MGVKVLVVDDSSVERHYFLGLLAKLGVEAAEAVSCEDGAEKACAEKFDLLFIDYFMPDADGVHTLKEIRTNSGSMNASVPAVALGTADEMLGDDFFFHQGFVNYLEKPVRFDLLHAALLLYLPEEKRGEIGSGAAEQEPEKSSALAGLEWLSEIPELSVEEGVKNCGTEEGFTSALNIFYNSIPNMSDEIQGYYESGDRKNYTIKVHALKSSARIIGLADLSELARKLEAAGDGGDLDFINENTAHLLEWYRSYHDKLSRLGGDSEKDDTDKPPADAEFLEDAFSSLEEFAGQMDFDMVDTVIESLGEYRLEPEDKEIFDEVNAAYANLDWNGIAVAARKYMAKLYG